MSSQRGILQLAACIALLTGCGSEYQPYTVAPESALPLETLIVHAGPNSTGTGTIAGSGIDCSIAGATIANTCAARLDRGKVVTLTAEATGSSTFLGWGDACAAFGSSRTCTVTVSQALAVSASFAAAPSPPPTYLVTVRTATGNVGSGAVSGLGINCAISGASQSGDCSEELEEGARLTLTAVAAGGGSFIGWGGACASAGTAATCTITVSQAATVEASFAAPQVPKYVVKVVAGSLSTGMGTVTGPGINCAISGTSQSGDCSEELEEGARLTLTAVAAGGGSFVGWSGACASAGAAATCTITVSQAATVEASFAAPQVPKYVVKVVAGSLSTGNGTITGPGIACTVSAASQNGDCSEELVQGTQLTLSAAGTGGSTFAGWGQACSQAGAAATCRITVSQATTVEATFEAPEVPAYVVKVIAGSLSAGIGTVTGPGINCTISGMSQSGDCSEELVQGARLTLTAVAAGGGSFLGWSGACASAGAAATCTITVSQAATVEASFTAPPPSRYVVKVAAGSLSTGNGTITGPGIACTISSASQSGDCSEEVIQGTQLTLVAAATGGSAFAGWGQACSQAGAAATCTITVSQATNVQASFAAPPPPNLAGFWSGTDAGTNIHYHITLAQSGATLSLGSCAPGDCRLISLSTTGEGWLGASYLDITSLSGTVSGASVTFTMTLGGKTVSFVGALTSPTEMVGQVSGTMPAQSLTLDKQ